MAEVCDREIYENGDTLGVFAPTPDAEEFERIVIAIRQYYGIRIDWHFAGGRIVLKGLKGE